MNDQMTAPASLTDHDDAFVEFAETAPFEAYLPLVENIVSILSDGFDHLEVWAAVAAAAEHDVSDLRGVLDRLRATQTGGVLDAVNLVGGILHVLTVDRTEGLDFLHRMLADRPHCPQVAGAIFFATRYGQAGPSPDLSDRFCDSPFVKFETLIDGTVAPCCSIWTEQRLGKLDGQTAAEIWNSPAAQAMRASILDGSFRHCNKLRCSHIIDDRLPVAASITDPSMRKIIDGGQTEMDAGPNWVFLAHDLTCNLSCPSCRDKILAADEAQERRFEIIERDVLHPLLDSSQPVRLSVAGQGDPWSSPHYRSILRHLADHDLAVKLEIHTNALLMSEKRWAEYAGLDKYRALVDVSIDAATPWVFEVVRRPGRWEKLLPNLRFIGRKRALGEFREFHINTTVQLDNFHEMPSFVAFAQSIGADSARMYMIQNTGGHLAEDYARKNVADERHPLHLAFLETLRDPALRLPIAHLYDVANWQARSFEARLPSDALSAEYSRSELLEALRAAIGRPDEVVALCAAGRIRFPGDIELLLCEANALHTLGFAQQAGYRMKERIALGGENIAFPETRPQPMRLAS